VRVPFEEPAGASALERSRVEAICGSGSGGCDRWDQAVSAVRVSVAKAGHFQPQVVADVLTSFFSD
jgi:hypothetical protein